MDNKKKKKKRAINLVTHVEPHASAMSLLKRAENTAIKAIINQKPAEGGRDSSVVRAPDS